jgi:hypothetical protein
MSTAYNTFVTYAIKHPRPTSEIKIVPFGDIHRDSHACDEDRWKNFLKDCKANHDANTYYLGMGDYNDFASYSERKVLRNLHESTSIKMDGWALRDVDRLASELEFMRGNLIGLIHGNHEWQFLDGDLATEKLCAKLGCKFLGYATYVRISAPMKGKSGNRWSMDIFASHGKGGGQLLGSPYNNVEKMEKIFPNADIYLMGHDHHKGAISKTKLIAEGQHESEELTVKQRRQWFGRTGSFLRGWIDNEPSYVVGAMYPPTDLGTIRFNAKVSRNRKDGVDRVVKDITCVS